MQEEYLCPSFNSFGYLSEIAAKASDEFQAEENDSFDGEDDFEFSLVSENPDTSTVEFIYDGQTKFQPIFHVFNRDLLLNDELDYKKVNDEASENVDSSISIPLENLFIDTRKSTTSSTSSEADELETIPPGTYCVWKPKISESSPEKCKKSKSTGSVSKRWPRIQDLLRRCNSDGKDSIIFLTPKKAIENETGKAKNSNAVAKLAGNSKQKKGSAIGGEKELPAALYYVQNRAGKEVAKNRRKSYLPYRKELIGFFAIGLSRSSLRG
ncbi:hypothetical protein T459_20275 [Capsicum annuum]|uniref:Uncharacterized protein n=1 Tax=Capsicum annuum TaxID=4072 RepID=A0A1U8HG90_CAPAN|nr:putative phospholipid-transporting ATPase 8-like [Capsicum annuum]PHT76753.1 hypothetical protein T459_20275 [Capsicum annuum]